jgi:HEAT repeat protein
LLAALTDLSPSVRGAAAFSLGQLQDGRAVEKLISLTRATGETPDVRSSAAAALGSLHDKSAVDALVHLLKDDNRIVKVAAAIALADIGDKRAVAALQEATNGEKDEETRTQMKEALRRLEASDG